MLYALGIGSDWLLLPSRFRENLRVSFIESFGPPLWAGGLRFLGRSSSAYGSADYLLDLFQVVENPSADFVPRETLPPDKAVFSEGSVRDAGYRFDFNITAETPV